MIRTEIQTETAEEAKEEQVPKDLLRRIADQYKEVQDLKDQ